MDLVFEVSGLGLVSGAEPGATKHSIATCATVDDIRLHPCP